MCQWQERISSAVVEVNAQQSQHSYLQKRGNEQLQIPEIRDKLLKVGF